MSWQHFGRILSPFLLILWIFSLFNNVKGVPSDSIVTKARCYANCLTQNTPANKTEKMCQTSNCEECLIPCGASFSDEETCKQSCNNSSSCLKSCEFLAQLQNFSSILAGDGSLPPKPSIPTVTSKNFTSISLEWDPVQNTSGAAVYLIEMTFTGEQSRFSPTYLSEIFVSSQATIKFEHPCLYTKRSPYRTEYKDILFSFKIAVLTENSSVSYGPQTSQIILTKPESVTNVTLDSIFYDNASLGDKIKLTVSFIPPKGQEDLISLYGALFYADSKCQVGSLPRAEDSTGAEATISMHIFQKSLKCNHTLEIYSIVGCSVSDATVLNYTYPGCQNITDFPVSECYKFDPPYAPLKDRMVSNVTLEGPMTAQQDYRFTAAVTWNPPVYPYKTVSRYLVKWRREDGGSLVGYLSSPINSQKVTNLLPGTSYIIEIRPIFPDQGKPPSKWTSFILTTPGVDPDQVKVRQLTHGQFSPSPDGGSFSVHISWEKPTFNYSTLVSYKISYSKGNQNYTNIELYIPSPTSFVISGVLHGEKVDYRVIPRYQDYKWIEGITVTGNATAPVPRDDEIRIQNFQFGGFVREKGNTTFSVNCTWTGPAFNFTLRSYEVVYELSGYTPRKPTVRINVKTPESYLSGIRPKEFVTITVTPKFDNPNIKRLEESASTTAPEPDPSTVIIQNLTITQLNTSTSEKYDYLISWQKPQFNESGVSTYAIEYQRTGNPDRARLWKRKKVETFFSVQDLIPGDNLEVKVTPEFVATVVIGIPSKKVIEPPSPDNHEIQVQNLRSESFVKGEEINTFKVNFTWEGPSFKHSVAHSFIVSYEFLGGYSRDLISCSPFVRDNDGSGCSKSGVNLTFLQISGIYPRESVTVKVTPIFVNPHIQKLELSASATAPEPDPSTVKVQNLSYTELNTSTLEQFDYLISWKKPLFKESSVTKYAISYHRTGNPNRQKLWQFKKAETFFPVDDLIPGDKLEIKVTPEFDVNVITGISSETTIEPQSPENKEIQVGNLQSGLFVEDQESNTFSVNFTWESPSFKHSIVDSYIISYEFDGYSREQISCSPGLVRDKDRLGCSKNGVNQTLLKISGIFPREAVTVKITPIFSNIHITGKVAEERVTAPQPAEELVQVNDLEYDSLVPTFNDTFRTTVSWQKPKFTHSDVKYYKYKVLPIDSSQRERRGTALNTEITTTDTNATIDEISRADGVEFQVTPVFVVPEVLGADAKISLVWKLETDKQTVADSLSTSEIAGLVVGILLAVLFVICLSLWCYREKQRQKKAGRVSGKNAIMIDHWEVDGDLVTLEEELGEGAFGKVYKGILKELSTPSRKMSMMPPMKSTRKNTIKQTGGFTVAVKMLHDIADGDQRREFLEEIQLMKAVGSHKNIVNMVGCCTVEEPMFLLVEYIPYGDLLHYLRKRRGKVKEYLGDESRGPYRSTYCETYVIDGKAGGISIQATKSDRIYVNSPEAQAGDNGNIAILSFKQTSKMEEGGGTHNKGMTKEDEDESEETLTPGDLMAFAWQISEGMEYLARKGFVHRDLAARNVLVGEHKIAKVADFGLTRHVYEEKVYHAKRNRKLPLKWMSIEAIFDQTFTTQSDVWAFGVVLWELVTLGGTPYPTINNRELLRLLKGGYRMEKPDICNDEMFSMMTDCWMENPDDRPNFTQIREKLEEMMQIDNPYLDFSVLDESRDYYNVPSFNSLNEESADDELSDKESDELLKDESDDSSEGEKPTEDSNKNEIAPFPKAIKSPEMDQGTDSVGVDKIEFNNSSFRGDDFRDLKDVKVNIDSLEMALYRPGSRGLVL